MAEGDGPATQSYLERTYPSALTKVGAGALRDRWTDVHCDVDAWTQREGYNRALDRCVASGVMRLVNVGSDLASSAAAARLAGKEPGIWATAGIDALHSSSAVDGAGVVDLSGIELLLLGPDVVAVGECGLDFSPGMPQRQVQREVFAAQVALANAYDLLLVVHARDAWRDTVDVLRGEGLPSRVVLSPFEGDVGQAHEAVQLGFHLSFNALLLDGAHTELRDIAARCPPKMILTETTSPRGPHPTGGRATPTLVPLIGQGLAQMLGRSVHETALLTWTNARELYHLR